MPLYTGHPPNLITGLPGNHSEDMPVFGAADRLAILLLLDERFELEPLEQRAELSLRMKRHVWLAGPGVVHAKELAGEPSAGSNGANDLAPQRLEIFGRT